MFCSQSIWSKLFGSVGGCMHLHVCPSILRTENTRRTEEHKKMQSRTCLPTGVKIHRERIPRTTTKTKQKKAKWKVGWNNKRPRQKETENKPQQLFCHTPHSMLSVSGEMRQKKKQVHAKQHQPELTQWNGYERKNLIQFHFNGKLNA